MKNTKKFMQHILLGSAIFLSLPAVSFPGSVAFASASVEGSDLTTERTRLQALLIEKEVAVTGELEGLSVSHPISKILLQDELKNIQTLQQLTENPSLETIPDVLTRTMVNGAELAALDPSAVAMMRYCDERKERFPQAVHEYEQSVKRNKEKIDLNTAQIQEREKELEAITFSSTTDYEAIITIQADIDRLRGEIREAELNITYAYRPASLEDYIGTFNLETVEKLLEDKPLSLFVVVEEPGMPPRLDFTTFGKFQNAAHLITPSVDAAFGDTAATVEEKTNALLNALYTYDLRGATERGKSMKSQLAALSPDGAAASDTTNVATLQREIKITELEISLVQKAKQMWENLTESVKRNGRTT